MPFFGKKRQKKNWPKSGQKWPKLPQNRRNKSRGSARKSQRNPKISEKWPKRLPQCKMKMHQKSKIGQKSAKKIGKNDKKNRFSLKQLPKKGHFLKEMHHKKKNHLRREKNLIFSRLRHDGFMHLPPPGAIRISQRSSGAAARIPEPAPEGGVPLSSLACAQ